MIKLGTVCELATMYMYLVWVLNDFEFEDNFYSIPHMRSLISKPSKSFF